MALETLTTGFLNDLVISNPPGTDSKSQGDDHIRLIKTVLKNTFPLAIGPLKFRSDNDTGSLSLGLTFFTKSGTPANNDFLAHITVNGQTSTLAEKSFGRLLWQATDVINGSEDANFYVQGMLAGVFTTRLTVNAAGVTAIGSFTSPIANIDDIRMPGVSTVRWTGADANNDTYIRGLPNTTTGVGPVLQHVINGVEMARFQTGLVFFGKTAADLTNPGITLYSSISANTGRVEVVSQNSPGLRLSRVGTSPFGNMIDFHRGSGTTTIFMGSINTDATSTVYINAFLGTHWSQLVDHSRPATMYKGTVVESLDEICNWEGEEVETRLPKFKVSTTADSPAVMGIFLEWDETDELNDAHIATCGLGWVRMQAGQVIAKGDLVSSAGNGCGKKQTGTTVTSATLGKIASNIAAETYPDGSFRVPCMLFCG